MNLTRFRAGAFALALALLPGLALAQGTPAYQSGQMLAPHNLAKITRTGQIQDAGGLTGDALGRGVNPFSILDTKGPGLCANSAATTGAYNAFCLGHDSSGNPLLSIAGNGGAAVGTPQINYGGTLYPLLGSGSANMVGPNPTVANDVALWNNTAGTLTKGTGGDFAYTPGGGFNLGNATANSSNSKLVVYHRFQSSSNATAPSAIFGHLDNQTTDATNSEPDGIYGDLWYNAPRTFNGAGSAIRGNAYTIPQVTGAIAAAGSGYTNNDLLTIVGGTCNVALNTPPQFLVTVSGGVATALTYVGAGACNPYPTNPVSLTGGTGSGLTANLSVGTMTVTNLTGVYGRARHTSKGTVTNAIALFADGAYNTGGGTTNNAAGLWINPPYDSNYGQSYGVFLNGAFPGGALASNAADIIINPGGGSNALTVSGVIKAATNTVTSGGPCGTQMGGGTSGTFSSTGASCVLALNGQSGGTVDLTVNNLTSAKFSSTAAAVNYLDMQGGAPTGQGPAIQTAGADTNISMAIRPKGSGSIQLGSTTQASVALNYAASNAAVAANFSATRVIPLLVNGVTLYVPAATASW